MDLYRLDRQFDGPHQSQLAESVVEPQQVLTGSEDELIVHLLALAGDSARGLERLFFRH